MPGRLAPPAEGTSRFSTDSAGNVANMRQSPNNSEWFRFARAGMQEVSLAYVVIAEFRTLPGAIDAFLVRLKRHAKLSLQEPGCYVFDVCRTVQDPNYIVLYEVYADEAAYTTHQAAPYYSQFRDWAPPLLELKQGHLFHARRVLTRC